MLLASGVALLSITGALAAKPKPLYPNLKTLKPTNLEFDEIERQGTRRHVLRFSNTVWNAGQGPLDLRGKPVTTRSGKKTRVVQRIYDRKGGYKTTEALGQFVYHPSHNHMHFGDFAEYQLWTRTDYDKWISSGRSYQEQYEQKGIKTTFCVMDTQKAKELPGSPPSRVYKWCGEKRQGISVGWGDTYRWDLPDQWIDLGTAPLADDRYVLRSVADPKNRIYESHRKRNKRRESRVNNAAVTYFTVEGGVITVTGF